MQECSAGSLRRADQPGQQERNGGQHGEAGGQGIDGSVVGISDQETEANGHLKSTPPKEELADFMSLRGICLSVHDRQREAEQAWALARRLAPENGVYKRLCESVVASTSASTSSEPPQ